jgi:hypothetical protein
MDGDFQVILSLGNSIIKVPSNLVVWSNSGSQKILELVTQPELPLFAGEKFGAVNSGEQRFLNNAPQEFQNEFWRKNWSSSLTFQSNFVSFSFQTLGKFFFIFFLCPNKIS